VLGTVDHNVRGAADNRSGLLAQPKQLPFLVRGQSAAIPLQQLLIPLLGDPRIDLMVMMVVMTKFTCTYWFREGGKEYARQKLEAILLGRDVGLALLAFFIGLRFEVAHGVVQHFHKLQLKERNQSTRTHHRTRIIAHAHADPTKR
jgi:hypothetical protein